MISGFEGNPGCPTLLSETACIKAAASPSTASKDHSRQSLPWLNNSSRVAASWNVSWEMGPPMAFWFLLVKTLRKAGTYANWLTLQRSWAVAQASVSVDRVRALKVSLEQADYFFHTRHQIHQHFVVDSRRVLPRNALEACPEPSYDPIHKLKARECEIHTCLQCCFGYADRFWRQAQIWSEFFGTLCERLLHQSFLSSLLYCCVPHKIPQRSWKSRFFNSVIME